MRKDEHFTYSSIDTFEALKGVAFATKHAALKEGL
jgi:hypothetical protein